MLRNEFTVPAWAVGYTATSWDRLPDGYLKRHEVVGGSIYFGGLPNREHSMAVSLLWVALRRAAGLADEGNQRIRALPDVELRFEDDPLHQRRADVAVVRNAEGTGLFAPGEVLLAVEIVALDSRVTDTIIKRAEYAEFGIPHYWIVETRNGAVSTVTWYALPEDDKRYEVRACWTPAETPEGIRAEEPFPVRIAWDELAF